MNKDFVLKLCWITNHYILCNTAEQIDLRSRDLGTNAYSQFWRTIQGRKYFSFRVKARDNVHVILTNTPSITDAKAYEIRIGVNANTEWVCVSMCLGFRCGSLNV